MCIFDRLAQDISLFEGLITPSCLCVSKKGFHLSHFVFAMADMTHRGNVEISAASRQEHLDSYNATVERLRDSGADFVELPVHVPSDALPDSISRREVAQTRSEGV